MATRPITPIAQTGTQQNTPPARRRRQKASPDDVNVRFFLLKPGSTLEKPELGEEVTNIRQVLVRSFKNNQPFLTVMAWNAIEDMGDSNGHGPMITKQVITRPK